MLWRVLGIAVLVGLGIQSGAAAAEAKSSGHKTLQAFQSQDQLRRYLSFLSQKKAEDVKLAPALPTLTPAVAAPPQNTITVTGFRASESITNNQVAGVDEGDIVKVAGDFLVILRRGRIFTVSIAGGALKPVDAIDAYPPGVDPHGDWYDEMLISGDRLVVIGYSYARGGTQVNRFRLDRQGHLSFEDSYAIKSNDYYSSRNYASRLIGNTLILYSPHYLPLRGDDPAVIFPALRRWDDSKGAFLSIGTARDVFQSPGIDPSDITAVHTVMRCDLTAPQLSCKAVSILGPSGRVFYVSQSAVYVWVMPRSRREEAAVPAMVYRLPLDGTPPSALRAYGAPVDQMSFREARGAIDVLLRADSVGEAMWAAERSRGDVGMVHIPFTSFGDGTEAVARRFYRDLPEPKGSYYDFHNRWVGDTVLYGEGNGWGAPKGYTGALIAASAKDGSVREIALPHGVDRIEAMGRDAVVVGGDKANLHFTEVLLRPGKAPETGGVFVLGGAGQAETRSHGFFYKPDSDDGGVLGLPVSRPADPAYLQLFRESSAVVFVRRAPHALGLVGELPSRPAGARDDGCKASCVDWYGNSRPIFYGGRIYALMGYEIVEGLLSETGLTEKARINFAPEPKLVPVRN